MRIKQQLIDLGKFRSIAVGQSLIAFQNDKEASTQQVAQFTCSEDDASQVEAKHLKQINKPNSWFGLATDGKSVFMCGGFRKLGFLGLGGTDSLSEVVAYCLETHSAKSMPSLN